MGISTVQSYNGAQIFEAVGLDRSVVDRHFTAPRRGSAGSTCRRSPLEALDRHARGYPSDTTLLPVGGIYAWRRDGEHHMWNPESIALLQHAVRSGNGDAADKYAEFSALVNQDATRRATLRGLLNFRTEGAQAIPSTRSSRRARSSSASPRARCPWAPSPRRPTRRWPSR
jgi:glutamate synthase (NADPH/NADH) large chain/glutamate synthase (ferredoxin)